jgi:hypothetical protein
MAHLLARAREEARAGGLWFRFRGRAMWTPDAAD